MAKKNTKVKAKSNEILNKTFKNNKEYYEFLGLNKNIKVNRVLVVGETIKIFYKKA